MAEPSLRPPLSILPAAVSFTMLSIYIDIGGVDMQFYSQGIYGRTDSKCRLQPHLDPRAPSPARLLANT